MNAVTFGGRDGLRLELAPAPPAYEDRQPAWNARLTGPGIDVSLLCPEAVWYRSLADFLADLGPFGHGKRRWFGPSEWQSGDLELQLKVTQTADNTVSVEVVLTDGAPPRWQLKAEIELDPGAFGQIASDARRLSAVSLAM
ncbi:DUF6228 family protein [Svornostia abyssi]|uniref:DUF6228 family protein n=1 Tax=Svornostia abyssi TaxID=2898438 RepID=A0ABY5PFJ1_9ACTN|nr:DUF6228 family protein [Parviterribacteraceae bacterium J379]